MPVHKDKERNTWFYEFKKVINGNQVRKKGRGFRTKNEAIAAEYECLKSLDVNILCNDMTLDQLFEIYINYLTTKNKITTIKYKSFNYKNHISPCFGNTMLIKLTPSSIDEWRLNLASKNMSEDFTNEVISLFHSIIDYGIKKKYINNVSLLDSFEKVKIEKIANERAVWNIDQVKRFLDSFDLSVQIEKDYHDYFMALFYSGMRPNEFRCLQKKDIIGNYLNVCKNINSKVVSCVDTILPPKNKGSIRKVLMPDFVIEMLNERTKDLKPDDFIFGIDKPYRETNLRRMLNKHIEASKLPHIVIYAFRHSHATHLIRSGVPIKVVSKRLGHKDASTTMNVYWHLFQDDESLALEVLK